MADLPMTLLETLRSQSRWLNQHSRNVCSQSGEDGIVATALERLPNRNKWCIEFGAWDGKYLSNSYHLAENSGYNVVLIEGNRNKYERHRSSSTECTGSSPPKLPSIREYIN
jgi:hypothetical protein